LKIAYIVSRFPSSSETFIARELNHVAMADGVELEIHSLFPATETVVHASAKAWVDGVRHPSPAQGARDLGWWLVRRPGAVLAIIGTIVRTCARRPGYLARSLATVPIAAAIARRVRESGAEHVHAHYATFPALAAWACRRLAGLPYSMTVHAHDIFVTQAMLAEKVRDAAFVDAISSYNRDFLRPYGGDAETPVHVIHCGIELDRYPYRPRNAPKEGPISALCVASLQEHKGHRVLLEAVAAPDGAASRFHLTLIGDGPERSHLEEQARELGIDERVAFEGAQSEDEVRKRLDETDLFVLPSLVARDGQMEGLPVALMESLACGIPTVASRISGIPEIIRDGKTGYLAVAGDVASLRTAISNACSGKLDAAAARRLIEDEFDIGKSATSLVACFRASVGRSARFSRA
jgi:colanic acid/amylovoran biosynthesis glycosyltransferase